jgi:hypothetical protein
MIDESIGISLTTINICINFLKNKKNVDTSIITHLHRIVKQHLRTRCG